MTFEKTAKIYLSNWLVPRNYVAINIGPISIIKKNWYNKASKETKKYIERHENVHYQQFLRKPWSHYWLYLTRPIYRINCEIEAYAHNVVFDNTSIDWCVKFMENNYFGHGYSAGFIKQLLNREVMRIKWNAEEKVSDLADSGGS